MDSWATSMDPDGTSADSTETPTSRASTATPAVRGADLHLDLANRAGGLRASLLRELRTAIRTGRLSSGTRLPSSRSLSVDLGIARNTVAAAYAELVAEGWLTARRGSGTRVAPRAEPVRERDTRVPSPAPAHPERPAHDLRSGRPDPGTFPRAAWLSAARRALRAAPNAAFGFGETQGSPELRRALAGYLARARGVRTEPERIIVCAGFAEGLELLGHTLGRTLGPTLGQEIAVESYGLWHHRDILSRAGVRSHPLPVDERGARVAELRAMSVPAVLLTPAHQYPTGAALHPDRRAAVAEWASRTGGLVLEDDYDGEFRYDRQPVGALQDLAPERIGYLGTVSKSLTPALRLGWMVLPERLVEPVLETKGPRKCGVLDQLTLAELIESGAYDRHVRAVRQRYRRRRDRLVASLAQRAPHIRVTGIAAGLHAVLELPPGTEQSTLRAAARRGLVLEGLSGFRHPDAPTGDVPDAVVVGYGAATEHAFPAALNALCAALPG